MAVTALEASNPQARAPSASDERGAIMVLGLFLALGVVAAMWCVIGIGDAILDRELSQEAADSAAFTNAVVHARGMNLIAFINMITLVMTMLYVALSWIDMILSFLIILTGTISPGVNHCLWRYATWLVDLTINWCAIAHRLEKVERAIYRADKRVFDTLKRVGPPLFEVQVWAAQVVPYLGSVAAQLNAVEYKRPRTLSLSLSNYPGGGAIRPLHNAYLFDKLPWLKVDKRPDNKDPANRLQDRRIGLPVEGQAASQLCINAGRFPFEVVQMAFTNAAGNGTFKDFTSREPVASMIGMFAAMTGELNKMFFCQDSMKALGSAPFDEQEMMAGGEGAFNKIKAMIRPAMAVGNNALLYEIFRLGMWGVGASSKKFYLEGDQFWKMGWPDVKATDGFRAGPKKVVDYAYNGNDWMQIWAFTWADKKLDTDASRIVAMPAHVFGQGPASFVPEVEKDPESGSRRFLAQAEFYFDCSSWWSGTVCNKAGLAMYQLRWRARLRRVHSLDIVGDLFELFLSDFVNSPVMGDLVDKLSGPLGQAWGKSFQGQFQSYLNAEFRDTNGTSEDVLH